MNYNDFLRVMVYLKDKSGKKFPHGYFPGAMGEMLYLYPNWTGSLEDQSKFNPARTKAEWDSYQWDPPQYLQKGAAWSWKDWGDESMVSVTAEPAAETQGDAVRQFAFMVSDAMPAMPSSPVQFTIIRGEIENHSGIPSGWTDTWPGGTCWMIKRWVRRVGANKAISATDPNAMAKPTWEDMLNNLKLMNAQDDFWKIRGNADISQVASNVRKKFTDRAILSTLAGDVYVGDGLDHMTGVLSLIEQSNAAGASLPPVVLRDKDHVPKTYWLTSEVRQMMAAATERENVTESAHNKIIKEIYDKLDQAYDESKTWFERLDLINDYADLVENYDILLKAEIEKYDPAALPPDLPTLRGVLIERLEAKALGTIRDFSRSLTQQGVIAGAACDDEADAILAVKRKARQGATHIWNAETTAEAKAAHKTAVEAIEAVTPLNVPAWQVNGTAAAQDGQTANFSASTSDLSLTVRPVNPSGTDAEGPLGIYPDWEYRDAHGDWVDVTTTRTPNPIKIQFAVPKDTDLPMTATVRARNDCGDSTLVLTIEPKE